MDNKEITYSGKKYLPLKEYLQSLVKSRVMLSHKEIEKILGDELPESAYKRKAFWGNNRSNNKDGDHSNSWLEAGWEVEKIDKKNKIIHFKKGDKNMDKLHQRKCEKSNTQIGREAEEKTNDYIHNLWEKIILKLDSKPMKMQTIEEGRLFSAYFKNGNVLIEPHSTKKIRPIDKKEFTKIYQLKKKGSSMKFMRDKSGNVSYILALINHFEKEV